MKTLKSFRLKDSLIEQLKKDAKQQFRSFSGQVEFILEQYVKNSYNTDDDYSDDEPEQKTQVKKKDANDDGKWIPATKIADILGETMQYVKDMMTDNKVPEKHTLKNGTEYNLADFDLTDLHNSTKANENE